MVTKPGLIGNERRRPFTASVFVNCGKRSRQGKNTGHNPVRNHLLAEVARGKSAEDEAIKG